LDKERLDHLIDEINRRGYRTVFPCLRTFMDYAIKYDKENIERMIRYLEKKLKAPE